MSLLQLPKVLPENTRSGTPGRFEIHPIGDGTVRGITLIVLGVGVSHCGKGPQGKVCGCQREVKVLPA